MKTNTTAKEQSLHPVSSGQVHVKTTPLTPVEAHLDDRILMALNAAAEKKAIDLVVLDLREIASFTDHFVITSGNNERQVQAIADGVVENLKKSGSPVARIEGYKTAEWILLDYGDFVVHVFAEKARKFYDLERLWREAKQVALPTDLVSGADSSLRSES